jgi:hypothetical protein
MSNNEELSPKDELTNSSYNKTSSFTDCLSMGPIAAASRLMSSLSRQPRNDLPKESSDKNEKSPLFSSFLKPTTKRSLSNRHRSTSPKSPSSEPSISMNRSPFIINSSSTMRSSFTTPSGLNSISGSSMTPTLETMDLNFDFDGTYTQLRDLAETNRNYFSQQKNDVCRRFERLLILLSHSLELSVPLIRYLTENFHHFDYSSEVKANRSFLFLLMYF